MATDLKAVSFGRSLRDGRDLTIRFNQSVPDGRFKNLKDLGAFLLVQGASEDFQPK